MLRFTIRRILWFIPTILAMTAVTFVMMPLLAPQRERSGRMIAVGDVAVQKQAMTQSQIIVIPLQVGQGARQGIEALDKDVESPGEDRRRRLGGGESDEILIVQRV